MSGRVGRVREAALREDCGHCGGTLPVDTHGRLPVHRADGELCSGSELPVWTFPGDLRVGDEFQVVGQPDRWDVEAIQRTADGVVTTVRSVDLSRDSLVLAGGVTLRLWRRGGVS